MHNLKRLQWSNAVSFNDTSGTMQFFLNDASGEMQFFF